MTYEPRRPANRLERRKHRTRTALIEAAQGFIAVGKVDVPVLEITQAADVGMGSFYHFDSKEQLFEAVLNEIFDRFGALLDRLQPVDDPAETFARSFRLTVRVASAPTRRSSRAAQRRTAPAPVGSRPVAAPAARHQGRQPDWPVPDPRSRTGGNAGSRSTARGHATASRAAGAGRRAGCRPAGSRLARRVRVVRCGGARGPHASTARPRRHRG